jgi:GNAT superfamily N-acetyltransferase
MGLTPVPNEQLATIVTSLEMREKPRPRPMPDSPLRLVRWPSPEPEKYRALFRRVGTPWLWFSRLAMDEARLVSIIHDPQVSVFAVADRAGIEIGMLELDFAQAGQAEIAYFGLVPEATGQGHGNWLMANALAMAWAPGVERVWVHTCTLDHPGALGFYRRHGFIPYRRQVETFADPRIIGLLPAEAGPQIPCLSAESPR